MPWYIRRRMVRVTDLTWWLMIGVTWLFSFMRIRRRGGGFLTDDTIPDPSSTYNDKFKIVETIIKRQLEGWEMDKRNKINNMCMGISEETSTGVHHLYTMDKTCTNHQNWERKMTEVMWAKYYKLTSSFLILLVFTSTIFSSISLPFTVTEVPSPIFFLYSFASFLIFVIETTKKLLV